MGVPRAEQNRPGPIDLSEVAGDVRPVLPAGGPPPGCFSELCWPRWPLLASVGPVGLSS